MYRALTLRAVYDDFLGGWHVGSQHQGGVALLLPEDLLQVLEKDTLYTRNNLQTTHKYVECLKCTSFRQHRLEPRFEPETHCSRRNRRLNREQILYCNNIP